MKFNLELAEEKTRIIEFGRFARTNCHKRNQGEPKTFDFLGFTHYCAITRDGRFKLGTKTSSKRARRSLKTMNSWFTQPYQAERGMETAPSQTHRTLQLLRHKRQLREYQLFLLQNKNTCLQMAKSQKPKEKLQLV